ncbi:uncharacterized protein [Ptychodera flava]|uniref:uncharacterized protein n=1 Tax=Ptychodera flava TaxID=63121 RepID=UPI00396A66F1
MYFKKEVTLCIPRPQTLPGIDINDTGICLVLKDEDDNDQWHNVTDLCMYSTEEGVLKLKIKSISGYAVGLYMKDNMPRVCNLLSAITKFKKSGKQMVQILLLQHGAMEKRLECHLIEDIGHNIETLVKSERYSAFKSHTYQSNILMSSGDVIRNDVIGDFNLLTRINKHTYYPFRENHWNALVEPKDGHQRGMMTGLMIFHRNEEEVAELIFSTQSERKTPKDIASSTQNEVKYDYSSISNLKCLFLTWVRNWIENKSAN